MISILAMIIAASSVFVSFANTEATPPQEQTMNAIKHDSKKVYRKSKRGGRWVVRKTWRGGKLVTKRVWVSSKRGGRKAGRVTKRTTKKVINKTQDIVN